MSPSSYGPAEVTVLTKSSDGVLSKFVVTSSEAGGVSTVSAVAAFVKDPSSMSSWVTLWTALQVTLLPIARLVIGKAGLQSVAESNPSAAASAMVRPLRAI
ncbi:unannotated protein [freshwater metagenome]|uniref:Unannotated protein n=1 Tax=freshwater metagenome TaxID=449393 RepID=A0A6J7PDT4_9ZZZZ